jgi:hypothetical protein
MAPNKDSKGSSRKGKDAALAQHDPTRALAYILRGSKVSQTPNLKKLIPNLLNLNPSH